MIIAKMTISGLYYNAPFAAINAIRAADIGIVVITSVDSTEGGVSYDVTILDKQTDPETLFNYLQKHGNYLNEYHLRTALMNLAPNDKLLEIYMSKLSEDEE